LAAAKRVAETKDGAQHFDGLTYQIAKDIKLEKIDWLWPNRFAVGKIGLIAGFPDEGKSTVAFSIGATVSTGGNWPFGEGTAEQGAVVILSAEDSASDTIGPRLKAAGADMDQCIIVNAMVQVENGKRLLNLADDLEKIGGMIDRERDRGRNVKLVIVDPISAYVGGRTKGDSFKNAEMRALLTPLSEWAEKQQVAIIGITHFNKSGSGRALYRVTDSLAFTAAARTAWLTGAEQSDGEPTGRKLFMNGKSNIGPNPGNLAYKIEGVDVDLGDSRGRVQMPVIKWQGIVAVTADEALADAYGQPSKVAIAEDFLRAELASGPLLEQNIRKRANARKHKWRTIERAKANLKITSKRVPRVTGGGAFGSDGGIEWKLPESDPAHIGF
jgi:putative DNA primase/helicase